VKKVLSLMLLMPFTVMATATHTGTIDVINVQDRTIQVDHNTYALGDGIPITSPKGNTLSQGALAAGQKIQYSVENTDSSSPLVSPLPLTVTEIQIVTGFDDNAVQK
jgi:hypothetical protein